MKTYVIRRGDFLPKVAFNLGVEPDDVWNHPKNKDLRDLRKDWHILAEGDVLVIPDPEEKPIPIKGATLNSYVAEIPALETRVRVADGTGPFANEAYTVEGMGDPVQGTTDADGHLTISAPVTVSTVRVVFPARKVDMTLFVGDMDPITELSGVQARLAHLGFLRMRPTGKLDDPTVESVRAFQRAQNLDPTGQLDDATVAALKEAFGC